MSNFSGKMGKIVDSVAIRAYKRSKPVAAIDVELAGLQDEVVVLRSDLTDALSAISQLQTNYTNLLNNYNAHKHQYLDATIADTADGSGTLTETSKTTSTKV